ncbi:hypothetical protein K9M47_00580 [Candidatus Gracilibacteria bacterium]|nr:hypothetical protein [Candidatus Gracilibacteria bacterium]MCF7898638.1 hypothetical protein [Candidatus Paceibacterota bacterium]
MKTTKHVLRVILGAVFILVGILGVFLPILNGILFLLLGLILLSFENKYIHKHLQSAVSKNDFINKWYLKLDILMRKIFV